MRDPNTTIYEAIGGEETLRKIVEAFYPRVQQHDMLKDLFPEDIRPVMEKQFLFLTQFLGGPMLYSDQYGHPMMRARHMPFPITVERADAWLGCMSEALDDAGIEGSTKQFLMERFKGSAYFFVNQ